MNGLVENTEAADEATNAGAKLPMANPDDCPEVKPNPAPEPPNCMLPVKPTLPPKTDAYAGGSPGGGGGLTNGTENAVEVAAVEVVVEGNGNGLLKKAGEPMESPARGDGTSAAFLFPTLKTVKVMPSLNLRDAPSSKAASKISFD